MVGHHHGDPPRPSKANPDRVSTTDRISSKGPDMNQPNDTKPNPSRVGPLAVLVCAVLSLSASIAAGMNGFAVAAPSPTTDPVGTLEPETKCTPDGMTLTFNYTVSAADVHFRATYRGPSGDLVLEDRAVPVGDGTYSISTADPRLSEAWPERRYDFGIVYAELFSTTVVQPDSVWADSLGCFLPKTLNPLHGDLPPAVAAGSSYQLTIGISYSPEAEGLGREWRVRVDPAEPSTGGTFTVVGGAQDGDPDPQATFRLVAPSTPGEYQVCAELISNPTWFDDIETYFCVDEPLRVVSASELPGVL